MVILLNNMSPVQLLLRVAFVAALGGLLRGAVFNCSGETPMTSGIPSSADLIQLSLEDLGNIRVTSVSRKSESLSSAPAAIHVITQEDIRRSGVTSLAEALRLAPGLDVARANSRQWAIASRGFNGVFANALLVLVDGRTIYTPLSAGVFWEEADTVLEDIDRIEVIRGPGAAVWGANAVNGVINFVTKSSKETQGLLMSGGGGIEESAFGTLRYGGALGKDAHYRIYAKHSDRDEFTTADGRSATDTWWLQQSGFRVDWDASDSDLVTLQSDYYYGELGGRINLLSESPPGLVPTEIRSKVEGLNVLGRWTRQLSGDSEMSHQIYYDRTDRGFRIGREIRDTFDWDGQHRFQAGERNEIVWGGGYRYSADAVTQTQDFQLTDPNVGLQLFSAFAQDEITLVPDSLRATIGAKVEHNDFTGFEFQPSFRVSWTATEHQTFWGAISQAIRTPARTERGLSYFVTPPPAFDSLGFPVLIQAQGNPVFGSEKLVAYELGYRAQLSPRLTLDVATFYHDYDRLWSALVLPAELQASPIGEPFLRIPATPTNAGFGETYGVELSGTWQPVEPWRLRAGYTFLKMNLHTRGLIRSTAEDIETSNPEQQVFIRSEMDLGKNFEWGLGLRFVDSLPALQIPNYLGLDARLAWKPSRNCEIAIIGRDLLDDHHPEAAPSGIITQDVEVDRAVYAKVTLRF